MFWVALATAIMLLSGDGDDTRAIRDLIAWLRKEIPVVVQDPERAKDALQGIDVLEQTFHTHRTELNKYAECIKKTDLRFAATDADYRKCEDNLSREAERLAKSFVTVSQQLDAAVTKKEAESLDHAMAGNEEAKDLREAMAQLKTRSPATSAPSVPARRSRGLEGAEINRHITLPRNVVKLLFGPLQPQTFGQHFTNGPIEGGISYRHQDLVGGPDSDNFDQWFTRFGVAFGLFDDVEAGALFLPFELAPQFGFDRVLVFLTQQFRMEDYDLALKLSFQTPGGVGWSLSPGGLLRVPSGNTRLDVGLNVPMDMGTFRDPQTFLIGLNVPVRETIQFTPNWYITLESGFTRPSFQSHSNSSIPLGLGTGCTLLTGKRLIDITGLFQWDNFLMPNRAEGVDLFQPTSFRAVLGVSMLSQAL